MNIFKALVIGGLACAVSGHALAACAGKVPVSPHGWELFELPLCYQLQLDANPQVRVVGLGVTYPASQHVEITTSAVVTSWQQPNTKRDETMIDSSVRVGQFERNRYYAEAGITASDWLNTADKKNDWFVGTGVGYRFEHVDLDLTLRVRQLSDDQQALAPSYYRTTLGVSLQF